MLVTIKHHPEWGLSKFDSIQYIASQIEAMVERSRFTADVETKPNSTVINIRNIRLRHRKMYCGNHPAACEVLFDRPHRRGNYLEGADWVEWNDRLNDLLDVWGVEAYVRSSVCVIREGRKRRTLYDYSSNGFGNNQWTYKCHHSYMVDYCDNNQNEAPNSWFPSGTPGIYERNGEQYSIVG